jgi:GntR family transcriptional repressor for pyruvate dehydrogenase complex
MSAMATGTGTAGGEFYKSVTPPKTSDLVARQLRAQIIRGELATDAALPSEAELMKQFRVSRPTLREAYRVLESEGLIVIRRGAQGGARVQVPDPNVAAGYAGIVLQYQGATLRDLADARQVMEPPAAGILARRKNPDDVAELERLLAEEPTHESERELLWYDPFHVAVVELTGNLTLTLFARMTGYIMQVAKAKYLAHADELGTEEGIEAVKLAEKSHQRLIDYIKAGDGAGAEDFWARHLAAASDRLLTTMPETRAIDLLS